MPNNAELKARSALGRIYNLERFREHGVDFFVQKAEQLLEKTKQDLGCAWVDIERAYPAYKAERDIREALEVAWETKCHGCQFWSPDKFPGQDEDAYSDVWCEKYSWSNATRPNPCPKYEGRK